MTSIAGLRRPSERTEAAQSARRCLIGDVRLHPFRDKRLCLGRRTQSRALEDESELRGSGPFVVR
jgi:hypothetical protein